MRHVGVHQRWGTARSVGAAAVLITATTTTYSASRKAWSKCPWRVPSPYPAPAVLAGDLDQGRALPGRSKRPLPAVTSGRLLRSTVRVLAESGVAFKCAPPARRRGGALRLDPLCRSATRLGRPSSRASLDQRQLPGSREPPALGERDDCEGDDGGRRPGERRTEPRGDPGRRDDAAENGRKVLLKLIGHSGLHSSRGHPVSPRAVDLLTVQMGLHQSTTQPSYCQAGRPFDRALERNGASSSISASTAARVRAEVGEAGEVGEVVVHRSRCSLIGNSAGCVAVEVSVGGLRDPHRSGGEPGWTAGWIGRSGRDPLGDSERGPPPDDLLPVRLV